MNYNFDKINNRKNTDSIKWDFAENFLGGKDILPMWVADMDFDCPIEVAEAIKKRTDHNVYGYTKAGDEYHGIIIDWFTAKHNLILEKEWLIDTIDIVSSLSFCVQELSKVGDSVLIQTPVYKPFFDVIKLNKRKIIETELILKNKKYFIDFDDFEKKISQVKIFILCSPHNPIGRVWSEKELSRISELCVKYGVIILSDEIHCDWVFANSKHSPTFNISEEIREQTIMLYSGVKTFNLAGLKTSLVIIKNPKLRRRFNRAIFRNHIFGGTIFGFEAMKAAYTHGEDWLINVKKYIESNKKLVIDFFSSHIKEISVIDSDATFLLWIDFRGLHLSHKELLSFLLEDAKLGFNDGKTFGKDGVGFMRMNIACSKLIVKDALERILTAYKKLRG